MIKFFHINRAMGYLRSSFSLRNYDVYSWICWFSAQYFSTYKFVNLCSFKAEFEEIFGKIHVLLISSIKDLFILVFPFKQIYLKAQCFP